MSQLSKVLEKRIQELTASIDAQKTELAAYERVLHMETTKGSDVSDAEAPSEEESPSLPATRKKRAIKKYKTRSAAAPVSEGTSASLPDVEYKGNKTNMVVEIVNAYGSQGATPKDVDAVFTAKRVERSKNLIYNTLSYLVAQKKLQRKDGKYFGLGGGVAPAKKAASTPVSTASESAKTKRRLSPEGLKRIKDALKRRWAAKHAADAAAAAPAKPGRPAKKRA